MQNVFPFQTLRAVVGGASAIDVGRLHVEDHDDAERFLAAYGYRWDDPEEREELEYLRTTAIAFVRDVLLEPGEAIPEATMAVTDVRELLLAVSSDTPDPWACGLLRVMHTLAHAESDFTDSFAEQIEAQILGRFEKWIREDAAGLRLGDVPLVRYESRARKELHSLVLKLLHKPENVAADIFDRLGVRFVTRNRLDALLVVRFLRVNNVIMFANVKPSRSKNTLVDLARLEAAIPDAADMPSLAAEMEGWAYPDAGGDPSNPYSAKAYHAIQFTGRQRVRVSNASGEVYRFFFPFEVQVLDEASWLESRKGWASHADYKERQRQAARRRVLGGALGVR